MTPPLTLDHPVRGRLNAALSELLDGYMDRKLGARKRALFGGLPGVVVELGPGGGANFRYFPQGTRVIGFEPNLRMHGPLRRSAERLSVQLELRSASAESMDLPDSSVDAVVATLVLCSVQDPRAVLREVLRILRPGGRFTCIEHIAAPEGSFAAGVQRWLRRPWRWLFEGCDIRRPTPLLLEGAGFSELVQEAYEVSTLFVPLRHQVAAVGTK